MGFEREKHEFFTSQVVLDEIAGGDAEMARQRLELVAQIKLLDLTDDAKALTKDILGSGVLPADADRDAAHIALATVHEMDILLSWNCRHIANAAIQPGCGNWLRPPALPFRLFARRKN